MAKVMTAKSVIGPEGLTLFTFVIIILACTYVHGSFSLIPSLLTRRAPLSIAAAQKREPGTLCTRMREILLEVE